MRSKQLILGILVLCGLWSVVCSPWSASSAVADDAPRRFVTPVRLSLSPQSKLTNEVARTRAILEKFEAAGYERGVWVVNDLPEKDKEIRSWVRTCLEAFPSKPVLAIDSAPGCGNTLSDPRKLKVFLRVALPKCDSVIVNYTMLNNHVCITNKAVSNTQAVEIALSNAKLVKKVSRRKFIWVMIFDDKQSATIAKDWTDELDEYADGYWLYRYRWIYWNAGNNGEYGTNTLLTAEKKKPIVRGNFFYRATRVRPGLRQGMTERYHQRMGLWEDWLDAAGYAGFAREIGEEIPNNLDPNRQFVPEANNEEK
jgi:hypothetical protein